MTAMTALWTFMLGLHIASPEQGNFVVLDTIPRVMHLWGVAVVLMILYFCILFPDNQKVSRLVPIGMAGFVLLTAPVYFFTDCIVGGKAQWIGHDMFGGNMWTWNLGPYYFIYAFLFMCIPFYSVFCFTERKNRLRILFQKKY